MPKPAATPPVERAPVRLSAGMTFAEFRSYVEGAAVPAFVRQGQHAFNILRALRPDLAERTRGTAADPFYLDHVLPDFWQFLRNHWQQPGETKASSRAATEPTDTEVLEWLNENAGSPLCPRKLTGLEGDWFIGNTKSFSHLRDAVRHAISIEGL